MTGRVTLSRLSRLWSIRRTCECYLDRTIGRERHTYFIPILFLDT
jgi:hypothetical protein